MALWDITHGGAAEPLLQAADPDEGPYFVEGKAGVSHGPYDFWDDAGQKLKELQTNHLQAAVLQASKLGRGPWGN